MFSQEASLVKQKQMHFCFFFRLVELSVLALTVHMIFWIILTILQDQTYPMIALDELECFLSFHAIVILLCRIKSFSEAGSLSSVTQRAG